MKVLIIEDEAPACRRLEKLINDCDASIRVVGIIQSVTQGIEWFQVNTSPDLIFSDIQLADGLSFNIFKTLQVAVPVIFITAYDEYAINAFKFYSIDYLLKPVHVEELIAGIEKFRTIQQKQLPENIAELFRKLTEKRFRERFLVYHCDSLIPLRSNDIAYFTSEDGSTIIVTHENKRYFIEETLETLENVLNPIDFIRANRKFILSMSAILKISNYGLQKLKITVNPNTDDDIIISKLKATQFKKWLNR